MNKVAIVSCYYQKNYGSMLQAFATQQALDVLGYNNETVCIDGIAKEIKNRKVKYYLLQLANPSVVKGKLGFVKRYVHKKLDKEFSNNIAIRDKKFIEFRNSKFKVSQPLNSWKELNEYSERCSSVLVGSDQNWLPSNIDADYYTLSWASDNVNKISYAPSFGVSSIPKRQYGKANRFINRIQHASVREDTGKKIVSEVAKRDIPVVCDPTLLISPEEWKKSIPVERIIKEKYIFCYFLGNNPDQREFVKRFKEKTGLKIVSLLHIDEYIKSDCDFPDISPYDVGPSEFVNLIRSAEYVFTDSFHCTIFSVLNNKKFFTFRRFKEGLTISTNSRIHSLFKVLGIPERFITTDADISECIKLDINYEPVHDRLEIYRQESIKFLKKALEAGK